MPADAEVVIIVRANGVAGLEIRGGVAGHPAALRLGEAILPAVAFLDAMARDFTDGSRQNAALAQS